MTVDRRALGLVCLYAFFGFGHEAVMAGVLPLVVIARGGDAAFVGLLVAAYGIPTIALRPLLGRLLDTPTRPRVVRAGAAILSVAPLGFIIPSLATMVVTRVIQGSGWAAYGTSGHAILARVAPPGRRGEAAGYYNAMPSLAILLGPAVGLWLYANVSEAAPFVLSAMLGLGGLALTGALLRVRSELAGVAPSARSPVALVLGMFDRSAVLPMLLIGTFMSVQSLFVIFAPVYASENGVPIEQLAVYYPVFGIVVLIGHITLGRTSDRVGRWPAVAVGCSIAIIGLLVSAFAGGLGGLLAGGVLYGIATALVTATVSAVTMENAPPERSGSAMATYSVGYQLGASVGGAAWGTVISLVGYPWPFLLGALLVGTCLTLAALRLPRSSPGAARAVGA